MFARAEASGLQHLDDAAIEALNHAVGLRPEWSDQAMVDAMALTELVEGMLAGGFALTGGAEAVGKLLAIVREHPGDMNGAASIKRLRKPWTWRADLLGRIST